MSEPQSLPMPQDPEGLRELLALYPELRAFLEARAEDANSRRTVAELVQAYLADCVQECVAGHLSDRTYERAADLLGLFRAAFGERLVTALTPLDLKQWIEGQSTWKSAWTRKGANLIVQRLFNWAVGLRLIAENPVRGVLFRRGSPRRPMTDQEYAALLRQGPAAFRRVLVFMKLTGARTGEVLELGWPDVDLVKCVAVLPPERHKTGRKTGKPRVIVLVPTVVKLLAWIQRQGHTGAVFCNANGRPLRRDELHHWMVAARKAAGLPADCYLYGLRHRFGTEAAKQGLNLKVIATLMGHARTEQTEHYLSTLGQDVAHLLEAAQRIVGGGDNGAAGKPKP